MGRICNGTRETETSGSFWVMVVAVLVVCFIILILSIVGGFFAWKFIFDPSRKQRDAAQAEDDSEPESDYSYYSHWYYSDSES